MNSSGERVGGMCGGDGIGVLSAGRAMHNLSFERKEDGTLYLGFRRHAISKARLDLGCSSSGE
jgi:hypothetical protein